MQDNIRLIINADDFGYFPCISRGIADAVRLGRVTATGVLATQPDLAQHLTWIKPYEQVDIGVHLNLTWGLPLTPAMTARLAPWDGRFPGLGRMARLILVGSIKSDIIREELRAQIDRCVRFWHPLAFLNSHQHIHMLPPLFEIVIDLAREYGIPAIRIVRGTWRATGNVPAMFRNIVFGALEPLTPAPCERFCPTLVGLNESGRLSGRSLERVLRTLRPGGIYELMCHPGHFNDSDIRDDSLIRYHDWNSEYSALTSPALAALMQELGITLTNFRSITSIHSSTASGI